jgi:peptidylprolyl isomerase
MPKELLQKSLPLIIIFAICGILIAGISLWVGEPAPEIELTSTEDNEEVLPAPLQPEQLAAYDVDVTNNMNPIAVLQTNQGTIEVELYEDVMPITAGNFAKLVNEGFYNGIKFHRVINGFMIQGGDPITKTTEVMRYGTGGPGYSIPDEHIAGAKLSNVRGSLSMANSGPNSGGSQFFINLVDNTNLDFDKEPLSSKHPVFGQVVAGMEVVDAIAQVAVTPGSNLPLEEVVIETATIRRP